MKFAGDQYMGLEEAKKLIEDKDINGLNLDEVTINNYGEITIGENLMAEELWDYIKAADGDRTVPYRVTLGKIDEDEVVNEIGRIAIYRDGTVNIEEARN